METQNRIIWCCRAKIGALVVGIIETIIFTICLLWASLGYSTIERTQNTWSALYQLPGGLNKSSSSSEQPTQPPAIALELELASLSLVLMTLAIVIGLSAIQLILGIILIMGVKEKNATTLQIWRVVQIIFLVLEIPGTVDLLIKFKGEFLVDVLFNILMIVILQIVSVHIVHVYRKELLLVSAQKKNEFRLNPVPLL